MSGVSDNLATAGLVLPPAPAALGAYVPAVRAGVLVLTAGQLPLADGELLTSGHVGAEVDLEAARACARQAALNALAAASTVCDLDTIAGVARMTVYVASAPGFSSQPQVADGASEVLIAAFGDERGRHARVAVGVAELPKDAPVEVELVLQAS